MHCRCQEAIIHVVVTLEVDMKPGISRKKRTMSEVQITTRNPGSYLKNINNSPSGCSFICFHLVCLYVLWCVPGFLS